MTTSTRSSLLAVALALGAGAAFAQAPANDTCAGAQVLSFGTDNTALSSVVTGLNAAAAAAEVGMPCSSLEKNTVWFAVTPPVTGTYRLETCGRTNYTSVLEVYTGVCGSTTAVAGSCQLASSSVCAPGTAANVALTAGTTYLVQVGLTPTTIPADAFVQLAVGLQSPPANDSCGGAEELTLDRPTMAHLQPTLTTTMPANDAQYPTDAGCFVGVGHSTTSTISAGNDVAFRFRAPATGRYSFRVEPGGPSSPNATPWLSSSCLGGTAPVLYDGNACVAAANRTSGSTTNAETLSCIPLTANQTTYLWVDTVASTTSLASWPVEVSACYPEEETNDTTARANALSCPVTGGINPAGDVDFFRVGRYPGARVYALVEGNSTSLTDFDLRLTSATDTLEYDDDDLTTVMGGNSAVIGGATLPDEEVFLRANYWSATTVMDPYRLFPMVKFGAPTPEQEPNDTQATANALGLHVSGTLASTGESDFFALDARVGDLVMLVVDSNPARIATNGNANHNLEVLDPDGVRLVLTSDSGDTPSATASPGTLAGTTPIWPAEGYVFRAAKDGRYAVRVSRGSSVSTNVGDYHLAISIGCGMVQPALTALSTADGGVAEGSGQGGDVVTLTGSGFDESTQVFFGAQQATITARTGTSLTVTTPPSAAGTVSVSATNFGNLTATLTSAWTFIEPLVPPTVTSVSPALGPTAGGTAVTLTGTVFKPGAEVTFTVGATTQPCANITVVSTTRITCTTPAMPAGAATVTVRNPADNFQGSLAAGYAFVPPPTLAAVTPASGLTTGGAVVTLTGTGFLDGAAVRFGTTTVSTGVLVASDGLSLTVTTPSRGTSGVVDVRVTNPDGQFADLPGGFRYVYPAPTLATLVPSRGFAVGGQTITLNGGNFLDAPAPAVTFGGVAATNVVRTSATRLTLTTPPGTGVVDVVVTNNDGQAVTATQAFTYDPAPSVSAVSPARGPVQGGTRITLTGQGFVAGAQLYLGGVPAFAVDVQGPTSLVAVTNAGTAGVVDVKVKNPDTQEGTLAGGFTYDPAPTLTALSPVTGSTAGGTTVTLTGTGFLAGAAVRFGTSAATGVTVLSATELTAVTPARPLGVVTVTVANPDGQTAQLPRAFRFVSPPTVTAVAPATGDVAGGTLVRVTGTNFGAQTTVRFGGTASPSVTFVSATALDALAPAHGPGAVDVEVVNENGDTATLAGAFTYTRAAPTVTAVTPASGLTTGGTLVSLEGTGFAAGATVRFGAAAATGVAVDSPTLLRAVVPAGAAGAVDVTVTNDDQQAATLAGAYTYVAPPAGNVGVVTDGGDGALVGEVDAGTGGGTGIGGGGCGCASVDASALAGLALGLVALRRRRR